MNGLCHSSASSTHNQLRLAASMDVAAGSYEKELLLVLAASSLLGAFAIYNPASASSLWP
jgi:hypothetical protein